MREKILEQARHIFMQYGIKSVTMDDLSKHLSISKKTLYEFFETKEELLQEILKIEVDRMAECLLNIEANNVIEKMIMINDFLIQMRKKMPSHIRYDLSKYYPEVEKEHKKYAEQKMFLAIKQMLEEGKAQNLFRQNLNTDIIGYFQVYRSYIDEMLMEKLTDYSTEEIFKELFDYHIRGICNENGLTVYEKTLKNEK